MLIVHELRNSGAKITTTEIDCGQYRKIVEVWSKKNSEALRAFVSRLICQYPDLDMFCSARPDPVPEKHMASVWRSPTHKQFICVYLDKADVAEYGSRWQMPLKALLAQIQEHGPKGSMAFCVKMDFETWQEFIGLAERETLLPSA